MSDDPRKFTKIRKRIARMKAIHLGWMSILALLGEIGMFLGWWWLPTTEALLFVCIAPLLYFVIFIHFVYRVRPYENLRGTVRWLNRDKKMRRSLPKCLR